MPPADALHQVHLGGGTAFDRRQVLRGPAASAAVASRRVSRGTWRAVSPSRNSQLL